MLSFRQISEKKTAVKINPKLDDLKEKEGKKCKKKDCDDSCSCHDEEEMSEAKKKDDSYLEVDFKKRQKNNEKARKEMNKVPSQKNPHFESTGDQAYGSQEEVSEESTEEVAKTETLLTFKQYFTEEGADALKDRRMERGGVDGNNRYDKAPARSNTSKPKGKTPLQKAADAKYGAGTSAMDRVKADIAAKYGKGAIMSTKKKK